MYKCISKIPTTLYINRQAALQNLTNDIKKKTYPKIQFLKLHHLSCLKKVVRGLWHQGPKMRKNPIRCNKTNLNGRHKLYTSLGVLNCF